MDLNTIRKRIQNNYYWNGKECINDFKTLFNNCYTYNKKEDDVVYMARKLEECFYEKLADMPKEEIELVTPGRGNHLAKKGRQTKIGMASMARGRPSSLPALHQQQHSANSGKWLPNYSNKSFFITVVGKIVFYLINNLFFKFLVLPVSLQQPPSIADQQPNNALMHSPAVHNSLPQPISTANASFHMDPVVSNTMTPMRATPSKVLLKVSFFMFLFLTKSKSF